MANHIAMILPYIYHEAIWQKLSYAMIFLPYGKQLKKNKKIKKAIEKQINEQN